MEYTANMRAEISKTNCFSNGQVVKGGSLLEVKRKMFFTH